MIQYISSQLCGLTAPIDAVKALVDSLSIPRLGLELFCHTHIPSFMQSIYRLEPELRTYPISIHGPFQNVEGTSQPGSAEAKRLLDSYCTTFEVAQRIGCRHVVFHSNECVVTPETRTLLRDRCLQNLPPLIELAAKYNQTLLVENLGLPVHGIPLFTDEEYVRLFSDFPDLGAIIDVGHGHLSHFNFDFVLSSLRERIVSYHLHNNDGLSDQHRRIREGTLNIEHIFSLYNLYTPQAELVLEYMPGIGITPGQIAEDIQYINQLTHQ